MATRDTSGDTRPLAPAHDRPDSQTTEHAHTAVGVRTTFASGSRDKGAFAAPPNARHAGIGDYHAAEMKRQQFVTLLEHAPDAIVILDSQGRICEWNPAAEALLSASRDEVIDVQARSLLPTEHHGAFDTAWAELAGGRLRLPTRAYTVQRDGRGTSVRAHTASIRAGGRFIGAIAILRCEPHDGSAVAADPEAPRLSATPGTMRVLERDELTGLPSRRRMQSRLAEPIRPMCARGVAVLDVDAFALVNETYGPDVGDEALQELARRLAAVSTGLDLGRWQADAFVWVVDAEDPVAVLTQVSDAVAVALEKPFLAGGREFRLTVSLGMAAGTTTPTSELQTAASKALKAAKDSGRNRAVWYSDTMGAGLSGGFRLGNDLHHGIVHGELRLHFQPIMDVATGKIAGVEALVRWDRPGVGLLSPVSFIEVAERTGHIVPLGAWVTHTACEMAVKLLAQDPCAPKVSINVSPRQLSDPGLVAMLSAALQETGCPPSALIIEITETALMSDLGAAAATLDVIKELGVGLDLDDFGTGYSSLVYLKLFPVDRIKIDQSFVAGLGSDYADTAIVASTIALAHSVGIEVVAEGVETPEQLELLREVGCDYVQGYLLSRPLETALLGSWLAAHQSGAFERRQEQAQGRTGSRDDVPAADDPRLRRSEADSREGRADQRDALATGRDGTADWRDRVADLRDDLADIRDQAASQRETVADYRESGDVEVTEAQSSAAPPATAKSQASDMRARSADGRDRARVGRDAAAHKREVRADQRVAAERDRRAAGAKRATARTVADADAEEPPET